MVYFDEIFDFLVNIQGKKFTRNPAYKSRLKEVPSKVDWKAPSVVLIGEKLKLSSEHFLPKHH